MIELKNLCKTFDKIRALQDVSFTVKHGELCGLLGPNGAGKSTLFKTVMGLIAADAGEITIGGRPVAFGEVDYKKIIGYSPESPVFYEYLTGAEFLHFIAAAKHVARGERRAEIQRWLEFFDLEEKSNELVKNYSHGMRRKLSLCAALVGKPQILLLDEATNGLDPEASFHFKNFLRQHCGGGGTVLFSTHIIETVEHLCDRIVILHRGRVLREMRREEWEGLRQRGSSLEQEFIAMVQEYAEVELA